MRDFKYLVNKNYREREQDMTAYRWETSTVRKKMAVACGFLVVAARLLACYWDLVDEAMNEKKNKKCYNSNDLILL